MWKTIRKGKRGRAAGGILQGTPIIGFVFEVSFLSTQSCFYLETAHHHEVRRPWKIEFGCTVVSSQNSSPLLLASFLSLSFTLFSFSLDHAHARSRARFLPFFLSFFFLRDFSSLSYY